jgi:hypothetical protein
MKESGRSGVFPCESRHRTGDTQPKYLVKEPPMFRKNEKNVLRETGRLAVLAGAMLSLASVLGCDGLSPGDTGMIRGTRIIDVTSSAGAAARVVAYHAPDFLDAQY